MIDYSKLMQFEHLAEDYDTMANEYGNLNFLGNIFGWKFKNALRSDELGKKLNEITPVIKSLHEDLRSEFISGNGSESEEHRFIASVRKINRIRLGVD